MPNKEFDTQFLVVGAGPGGEAVANRLADLGGEVVVVERDLVGGTCVNKGCIPVQFIIRHLLLQKQVFEADKRHGLFSTIPEINIGALFSAAKKVNRELRQGIAKNFDSKGIKLLRGNARIIGTNEVEITSNVGETTRLTAEKIVVASGANFPDLQVPSIESIKKHFINADEVFSQDFTRVPDTVAVYGYDLPAIELVYLFHLLGSRVTLISPEKSITAFDSSELDVFIEERLDFQGIEIISDASLKSFSKNDEEIRIYLETAKKKIIQLDCKLFINSSRREPDLSVIEESAVKTINNKPVLTDSYQSSMKDIFFIGDARGEPPYKSYKASFEGLIISERLLGERNLSADTDLYPRMLNLDIQIATVGLTGRKASAEGLKPIKLPMTYNAYARIAGKVEGYCTLFIEEVTGRIRGGEIVALEANNLIAIIATAIASRSTIDDLKKFPSYHPSLSEGVISCAWVRDG
ncbi:MAG: FAD-dependent oxidoreductase [Candidatus Odinarchaeota archaeon]